MQIIKEKRLRSTSESLKFFKDNLSKLGEIKYLVLYYAEREWVLNHELYHQYVIVIGEKCQLWMSGLAWGYYGTGPYGLFELMHKIDPSITYEQIESLEWMAEKPIMFENVKGKLELKQFDEVAKSIICGEANRLPWERIALFES